MGLLDVNALVALAWADHVHHVAANQWLDDHELSGWATCAVSEAGFVRLSSNAKVLANAVSVTRAREVLGELRAIGAHRFLANDVSLTDADVPVLTGHRQVTDAVLLTLARRHGLPLVTFDAALASLGAPGDVEVLVRA